MRTLLVFLPFLAVIKRQLRPLENMHGANQRREHDGRRLASLSRRKDDSHFTGANF